MRSYRPEELFDDAGPAPRRAGRAGARGRAPDGGQPARQRRRPAARPAAARFPRLRHRRARARARSRARTPARCGKFLRDVIKLNDDQRNFRIFGPDETASNRLTAVFEATNKQWEAEVVPTDDHLAPDGPRDGDAQRAPVRGLAGGLPAHRPARAVQLLRGVHPHHRLDVQPARQVAEGDAAHPLAAADRLAELSCWPRTSGGRTTTASPTRTPASSTTWSTRRPRSSASTCRRTPTRCSR